MRNTSSHVQNFDQTTRPNPSKQNSLQKYPKKRLFLFYSKINRHINILNGMKVVQNHDENAHTRNLKDLSPIRKETPPPSPIKMKILAIN